MMEIYVLILTSSSVAAVVSGAIAWLQSFFTENKLRKAGTVKLAVALEDFALSCAEKIYGFGLSNANIGPPMDEHSLPVLGSYPNDILWHYFDSSLCAEVLGFPNQLRMNQVTLDGFEEEDSEYYGKDDECSNMCRDLGRQAFCLATRLRDCEKLKPFTVPVSKSEYLDIVRSIRADKSDKNL